MNKRQHKKALKKQSDMIQRVINNLPKVLNNVAENIIRIMKDAVKAVITIQEKIKTMSDDEFMEFVDKLTPEQREIAYKWRGGLDEVDN